MSAATLTEIREAVAGALTDLPEAVSVVSRGGSYDDTSEKLAVRILVGEPGPESEARVDELLAKDGGVRSVLVADPTLGGVISALAVPSHAGYVLFERPGEPATLGTELVVQIYA